MSKDEALKLLKEARISKQSVSYRKALNIINKMGRDFQLIVDCQKSKIQELSIGIDDKMICENCSYCEKHDNGAWGDDSWCSYFANRTTWQDFCSRFEEKQN